MGRPFQGRSSSIQSFRVCCAQGPCHGKSKSIKVEAVKKTRAVRGKLTSTDAVVIYKMKLHKTSKTAAGMATKYSITPKAVRDIWTHVTWTQQTKPFWTTRINTKYDHVIAGANHDRANASHPTPRRIWNHSHRTKLFSITSFSSSLGDVGSRNVWDIQLFKDTSQPFW